MSWQRKTFLFLLLFFFVVILVCCAGFFSMMMSSDSEAFGPMFSFVMTLAFLSYADVELILLLYGGRRSRASGIPVLFFLVVLFMILFVMILFYGLSIQEYESQQDSISYEEYEVPSAPETNSSSVPLYAKEPVASKESIEFKSPEVPVHQLSENDEGDYQELPAIFSSDEHEEIAGEATVPSAANLLVKDVSLLNRIPSKPLILYTFPSLEKLI